MTGLSVEQVFELADRVEDYLDGWQPVCGRRRAIGLFEAIVATLFYYRHNQSQQVTVAVFGVSQPTVSRIVTAVEEPIAAVCDSQVPELVEVLVGRVILVDGTLVPTGNRAGHRELAAPGRCSGLGAIGHRGTTTPRQRADGRVAP